MAVELGVRAVLRARCCLQPSPCPDVLLRFGTAWLGSSAAPTAPRYPRGCLRFHSAAVPTLQPAGRLCAAARAVLGASLGATTILFLKEQNPGVSPGTSTHALSVRGCCFISSSCSHPVPRLLWESGLALPSLDSLIFLREGIKVKKVFCGN